MINRALSSTARLDKENPVAVAIGGEKELDVLNPVGSKRRLSTNHYSLKHSGSSLDASKWGLMFQEGFEKESGVMDASTFVKMFLIHITFPFSWLLVYMWYGKHAIKNMMFMRPNEWLVSCFYIFVNVSYFTYGTLFFGEILLTDFFILFRSIMIAIKYSYLSKENIKFLSEPHSKEEIDAYHGKNNILSAWLQIKMETIYREIDSASYRVGEISEETLIYFRKKEQLLGYVKKSEYDSSHCSLAKAHNFDCNSLGGLNLSNELNKSSISVGLLSINIINMVEKNVTFVMRRVKYINLVFTLILICIPLAIRGYLTGNPVANADCIHQAEKQSILLDNASAATLSKINFATANLTPQCYNIFVQVFSGFSIVINCLVGATNIGFCLAILFVSIATFKRKYYLLKEIGLLLGNQQRDEKSTTGSTKVLTFPPAISLAVSGNSSSWILMRKLLLDFGITFQHRIIFGFAILTLLMLSFLCLALYITIGNVSYTEIYLADRYIIFIGGGIFSLLTINSLVISLLTGDLANKQNIVHLAALADQRMDVFENVYDLDFNHPETKTSPELETHKLFVALNSIDGVERNILNQDMLYPISLFGMRADAMLLAKLGSVIATLVSLLGKALSGGL